MLRPSQSIVAVFRLTVFIARVRRAVFWVKICKESVTTPLTNLFAYSHTFRSWVVQISNLPSQRFGFPHCADNLSRSSHLQEDFSK
jgi:hypothetical protein